MVRFARMTRGGIAAILMLSSVLDRREERAERRTAHVAELRKRAADADAKLKRFYDGRERRCRSRRPHAEPRMRLNGSGAAVVIGRSRSTSAAIAVVNRSEP